jgi:leucyl aminopeptidase
MLGEKIKFDACFIGLFEDKLDNFYYKDELNKYFNGILDSYFKSGEIKAKSKEVTPILNPSLDEYKRFYFIGLGKSNNLSTSILRDSLGDAFKYLVKSTDKSISIMFDTFLCDKISPETTAKILGESYQLSTYRFRGYKTENVKQEKYISECMLVSSDGNQKAQEMFDLGQIYGRSQNSARNLVNTPPNILRAEDIVSYCIEMSDKYSLECEVLDKEKCEELGMGAFLAVNQGSANPPYLIVLKYKGKEKWEDVIGLVGKGVTYDTGGYSLKPVTNMVDMKTDMGGAAAVIGAMEIIGQVKPNQNVVAVIASTDNYIGPNAMVPDEVIVSLSGKTIEIQNTDAEGRLTLADAITYAKFNGATKIIDIATLTGSVVSALGTKTSGVLTNNEKFLEEFKSATLKEDERIWQFPIFEDDRKTVRSSKVADLSNAPSKDADVIMAAAFLEAFAEQTPWVHIDIAGTATAKSEYSYGPKGATGIMTRSLATLILNS